MDTAGLISVTDEEKNVINAFAILFFEVEELKKKYVAYTLDMDANKKDIEVLISEIDKDTNTIKSIPREELETVLEIYNQVKETVLAE